MYFFWFILNFEIGCYCPNLSGKETEARRLSHIPAVPAVKAVPEIQAQADQLHSLCPDLHATFEKALCNQYYIMNLTFEVSLINLRIDRNAKESH